MLRRAAAQSDDPEPPGIVPPGPLPSLFGETRTDVQRAPTAARSGRAKLAGRLGRVDRQPLQDGSKTPPAGLASVAWGGSTLHPK